MVSITQAGVTISGSANRPESRRRALVVVDDIVLSQLVTMTLSHGAFVSRVATTTSDALAMLDGWRPQLVILDLAVSVGQIIDRIRERFDQNDPVSMIALTRRGDLETRLAAFEQEVDDLLTVPFSPEEFLARVIAVLRRTRRVSGSFTPVLKLGDLEINILTRSVTVKGQEVALTPLEQSLLYLLAANAGKVMGRDEILDHLWGTDFAADSNIVDQHIRHLRAQLQDSWRRPRFIQTVYGQGYRFIPNLNESRATPKRP